MSAVVAKNKQDNGGGESCTEYLTFVFNSFPVSMKQEVPFLPMYVGVLLPLK